MSKPSNPSWTGACLQGNLRLLSPRLFAMGRGWRRGPSSHGQSATATGDTARSLRPLGSSGLLLRAGFASRRVWAKAFAEIAQNPELFSAEALLQHFCKGAAILSLDPQCTVAAARLSSYVITPSPLPARLHAACAHAHT